MSVSREKRRKVNGIERKIDLDFLSGLEKRILNRIQSGED